MVCVCVRVRVVLIDPCVCFVGAEPVAGYQILTLDFQATRGPSGYMKKKGAISTQKIPTFMSKFAVSVGKSGKTDKSSLAPGTPYSATVTDKQNNSVLAFMGQLAPLEPTDRAFAQFVVGRPHKFLAQNPSKKEKGSAKRLAFASWHPDTFDCSAEDCVRVVPESMDVNTVLVRTFGPECLKVLEPWCVRQSA